MDYPQNCLCVSDRSHIYLLYIYECLCDHVVVTLGELLLCLSLSRSCLIVGIGIASTPSSAALLTIHLSSIIYFDPLCIKDGVFDDILVVTTFARLPPWKLHDRILLHQQRDEFISEADEMEGDPGFLIIGALGQKSFQVVRLIRYKRPTDNTQYQVFSVYDTYHYIHMAACQTYHLLTSLLLIKMFEMPAALAALRVFFVTGKQDLPRPPAAPSSEWKQKDFGNCLPKSSERYPVAAASDALPSTC